ncbi:MAG: hypothetical protein P0Y55_11915 [Candidatus Cohnella colombiensis]|uniref:Uncharacterized protein n=1 Tax=Candidatus Cohnella colombiensis TaxID=3121368 RepID=A0AA95ETR8_9BACL|nr:MAG: hypothetical protein P0Y55_11915 [Cohnella sp.]
MNIHDISHAQLPYVTPYGVHVRSNYYAEYVRFCLSRRSYKTKQGKPLTRSETYVAKQRGKATAYQYKLRKRGKRKVKHG